MSDDVATAEAPAKSGLSTKAKVFIGLGVYLVYVLEILKLRRGRINPETGEFEAIELDDASNRL